MIFKRLGLFLGTIGCLAFSTTALAVVSSTSAEFSDSTTEGTSSTSKSTKKIFADSNQERLDKFVDHNFDRLQEEAARGHGSFLTDYVSLVGCQKSQGPMIEAMQKNYRALFNGGKHELVNHTKRLINNRSDLAAACEVRS